MLGSIINFVKLPFLLITIWAVLRFSMGVFFGVDYAPRGNAMFSVYSIMFISSLYYGAMSNKTGGYSWLGTFLVGVVIGAFAQVLILVFSVISLGAGLETSYYIHWDSVNIPEGEQLTMGSLLLNRVFGIVVNGLIMGVAAIVGRAAFSKFAPGSAAQV